VRSRSSTIPVLVSAQAGEQGVMQRQSHGVVLSKERWRRRGVEKVTHNTKKTFVQKSFSNYGSTRVTHVIHVTVQDGRGRE